jgi:hypothetical protein
LLVEAGWMAQPAFYRIAAAHDTVDLFVVMTFLALDLVVPLMLEVGKNHVSAFVLQQDPHRRFVRVPGSNIADEGTGQQENRSDDNR